MSNFPLTSAVLCVDVQANVNDLPRTVCGRWAEVGASRGLAVLARRAADVCVCGIVCVGVLCV